jgi:hypothetical protein
VNEDGEPVDQKEYRSMIGSLLYLTAMRSDIQFSVCLCAHFQASLRISHRQAVKRIFRYLRYTPELGLWYSTSSSLSLLGFSDVDTLLNLSCVIARVPLVLPKPRASLQNQTHRSEVPLPKRQC